MTSQVPNQYQLIDRVGVLFPSVLIGVRFYRMVGVLIRLIRMRSSQVRVVCRLFVGTCLVMFGRFREMFRGVRVLFGAMFMRLRSFL